METPVGISAGAIIDTPDHGRFWAEAEENGTVSLYRQPVRQPWEDTEAEACIETDGYLYDGGRCIAHLRDCTVLAPRTAD